MTKKSTRILAILLTCALMIGLLPALPALYLPVSATGQEDNTPVYAAAHSDGIVLDGVQDWETSTEGVLSGGNAFGVLWNNGNIYVTVQPKEADTSLSVTLGNRMITVQKNGTATGDAVAAWGEVVEVAIPFTVTSYEQVTALAVSMGNSNWSGNLLFTSLERTLNTNGTGTQGWILGGKPSWDGGDQNVLENGYRFQSLMGMEGENIRVNLAGQFVQLKNRVTNFDIEFDFKADSMPKFRPAKVTNTYISNGLLIVMTDDTASGYCAAISNTDKGLIFAATDRNNNFSYVELNKQVGDEFHVRAEWTVRETLCVYIDGKLVHEFENVTADMKLRSWGGANSQGLYLKREKAPKDETENMDFTVSNISFGKSYDQDPLAGLDFSAISGKNEYATKVEYDLDLMTAYMHPSGHFPAREITWDSAREDYITDEGKVTPGAYPLVVGLTAALKSDPTVNTEIWVKVVRKSAKFMVTSKDEVTMTLDGRMAEGKKAWKAEMPFSFTQGNGAPSGKLYGAWGQGKIYIAVEHKGAKTLELKLNRKTITLDLATGKFSGESYGAEAKVSGSVAEIYLPMLELGLYAYEYEQVCRFEAKLVGANGSSHVSKYQMDLIMSSEVVYNQNLNNGVQTGSPELAEDGSSVVFNPSLDPQSIKMHNLEEVNRQKDMTFSQRLQFDKLNPTAGGFSNLQDVTNGFHFWLIDGEESSTQTLLRAKIYNDSAKGLVLQIVKDNDLNVADIVLDKRPGEGVAFRLDLIWTASGTVKVSIGGEEKGTVSNVNVTHTGGGMGCDGYQYHVSDWAAKVTVSNVAFLTVPEEIDLSAGIVAGTPTVSEDSITLEPTAAAQGLTMSLLAAVDHSKAVAFAQKITVNAMEPDAGGFADVEDTSNGYHFWLIDGEESSTQALLRAKIYNNSEEGLVLQLYGGEDNTVDVVLGKAVGDTFTLELLWGSDNSVKVSVDNCVKATVAMDVVTYSGGNLGADGFGLKCAASGMQVSVSDIVLSNPYGSLRPDAFQITGVTPSADGLAATLSGENASMSIDGYAAVDHSRDTALLQTITVNKMEADKPMTPAQGSFDGTNYYFWLVYGASGRGAKAYSFANLYNSTEKGLVLQVQVGATLEEVVLNKNVGDTFTLLYVWGRTNTAWVYVDGELVGAVRNAGYAVTTEDAHGYNGLHIKTNNADTEVTVSNVAVENIMVRQNLNDYVIAYAQRYNDNAIKLNRSGAATLTQKFGLPEVDHSKDMMLQHTVHVQAMGVGDAMVPWSGYTLSSNNYHFYLVDGAAGQAKKAVFANMYNHEEKGLMLQLQKGDCSLEEVQLDKQVGDIFTIRLSWSKEGVAKIYIDGVLKGTVENVDGSAGTRDSYGYDGVRFGINNTGKEVNTIVQISDVLIGEDGKFSTNVTPMDLSSAVTENVTAGNTNVSFHVIGKACGTTVNGLEVVDHSKDMLIQQTICVDSMPVDQRMLPAEYSMSGTGYYFWLTAGASGENTAKTVTFANLYNDSEKGLVLQVQCGSKGEALEELVLNKNVGETFTLSYIWGKTGTVWVYVDGQYVGSVYGARYSRTMNNDKGYRAFSASSQSNGTKVTVSNVSIEHAGVSEDFTTYVNAYATVYNSNAVILRRAGGACFVDRKGIEEIDHSRDLFLEHTVSIISMGATAPMPAWDSYTVSSDSYSFFIMDGAAGQEKVSVFANIYNDAERDLVLQLQKGDCSFVEFELDKKVGDTFKIGLFWGKDGSAKVYVDGELKGTAEKVDGTIGKMDTYGYDSIRFGVNNTDKTVSTVVEVHDAVLFDGMNLSTKISTQNLSAGSKTGNVSVSGSVATFNMVAQRQGVGVSDIPEMNHNRDMIFSQTICVEKMPLDTGLVPKTGFSIRGNGYYFWLIDGAAGENKQVTQANLYNSSKRGLVLQIQLQYGGYADIVLDKQVGDTFTLEYKWLANGAVKVYVDGAIKGVCNTGTGLLLGDSSGIDGFWMNASVEGDTKVTVSNVTLSPGYVYASVKQELEIHTILEPIVDIKNVSADQLKLPTSYDSPYLGEIPLEWTSSDSSVWNMETGEISHSKDKVGKYTILTLTVKDVRDKVIQRAEAYATPRGVIEIVSSRILNASFANNVVLDGKVTTSTDGNTTDEGWSLATLLGETGRLGVQWDNDNLYLLVSDLTPAVEKELRVVLKGKTIDLSNALSDGTTKEIAISMSSLGIAANNYGTEIPATITLGEGSWSGSIKLTSTQWFTTDSTNPRVPSPSHVNKANALAEDPVTPNQGVQKLPYGYRLYDLFNVEGENPHSIRETVIVMGNLSTQEPWEWDILQPIGNRDVAVYSEFDFFARSMPVYQLGTDLQTNAGFATCGFNWWLSGERYNREGNDTNAPTVSMGIINTVDGLVFVARGPGGDQIIILNKYLGDYFRIGTRWEIDGSLTVFVDGEKIANLEDIEMTRHGFGDCGMCLNALRSTDKATSSNDNIDVEITNLAIGQNYGDTLLDTLTWEVIRGKNVRNMAAVTRDVKLVEYWQTAQLPTPQKVTWTSSDESVLNTKTGDVTRPEGNGKLVYLTATCAGEQRVFELFVRGLNPDGIVMGVLNDLDTANGVGKPDSESHWFTLDEKNNSIIYDQGQKQKVNYIELVDTDDSNRLNESVVTIWYSDDNVTYTRMEEYFKILRAGVKTYLYDFEIEARYVKVHSGHYKKEDADFVGVMKDMIRVGYQNVFGDADTEFATKSSFSVKNDTDMVVRDQSFVVSPEEAGVNCLKADMSDVRFFLAGEMLYHYYDGKNFVVRVNDVPANGAVAVDVLSGNAEAMDISNKEYVYEVVYGTREAYTNELNRYFVSLPDGRMLGFKQSASSSISMKTIGYYTSYDGGMSWKDWKEIFCATTLFDCPMGCTYDDNTGRIIVTGYMKTQDGFKIGFIYSDDLGKTWNPCPNVTWEGNREGYILGYDDPLVLSCNDGDGPNVDMVMHAAVGKYDSDGTMASDPMWTRVLYSRDGGINWTVGPDEIKFSEGKILFERENGINESTIIEDENGRLIMLSRCQFGDVFQFARCYSYDWGLTWETENGRAEAELSGVYAPNTQPDFIDFNSGKYLLWGGNNVLGGASYMRFPMNIAVSNDNMQTFVNIQDLYSRHSMQGVTMATRCYIMNPRTVVSGEDSIACIWNDDYGTVILSVRNFTDYFYRTRGAYDSFENSTVKYEGWATGVGSAAVSDEQATDGNRSMKLMGSSAVVRSIPYVQNGKITVDIYLPDANSSELEFELETAYATTHGQAAPVALSIREGKIYALNADRTTGETVIDAQLRNGWNQLTFDMALMGETPAVTMSVNGGAAGAVPVAADIGNFITFVHVTNNAKSAIYLDNFHLTDNDNFYMPEEEFKSEHTELTEVPEEVKASYTDVEQMVEAMRQTILGQKDSIFTAENSITYQINLLHTRDGGKSWKNMSVDRVPNDGFTVVLPYPEGTNAQTHSFAAAQIFTENSVRLDTKVGECGMLEVTCCDDGIHVQVKNAAPIMLTWEATGSAPNPTPDVSQNDQTNDNTLLWIILAAAAVLAIAAAAVIVWKKTTGKTPKGEKTEE